MGQTLVSADEESQKGSKMDSPRLEDVSILWQPFRVPL